MSKIPDKSVQLIITSPPYWQLKDYGNNNQIGFNDSYEEYINNLNLVWSECYRVLSDGCRLCVNIGDQFARSVYYGRYKVIPIREEIIRCCETIGMDYMGAIIWQKTTTMHTSGGGAIMGSFPYPRNGILKMDYEFILLFKKLGNSPKPAPEQKKKSELTKEEWSEYFSSHWYFKGIKQEKHLAMFPEELPKRLIKMFSFSGETILDPFMGSGTTALAAKHSGRNSIGYEINKEFKPVIEEKIIEKKTKQCKLNFEEDTNTDFSFKSLPYIFKDPHKMDKKIDVKKQMFGSKIDGKSEKKQKLFTVKNVISPEILELSNGQTIKLIGIKEIPEFRKKATEFLEGKFKKRRIFLKPDLKHNQIPMAYYVYLDNKTFINNHLIRTGFVDVDFDSDYSCKKKFEKSFNEKRAGN